MITQETGSCELGAECSYPPPPLPLVLFTWGSLGVCGIFQLQRRHAVNNVRTTLLKRFRHSLHPDPHPDPSFAHYPSRGVLRIFVRQLRHTERERERVELIKYIANTWNDPAGPRPELNYTELGWAGLDEAGNRNWLMGRPALRLRLPLPLLRRAGNMHGLSPAQHLAISSKWAKMNTKQRRKKFECALSGRIGSFVGLCCWAGGACATDQKVKNLPCCNLADFISLLCS